MTFSQAFWSDACERNIYYTRFRLTTPLAVSKIFFDQNVSLHVLDNNLRSKALSQNPLSVDTNHLPITITNDSYSNRK